MTPPRSVPREFYDEMKRRAERRRADLAQYRAMYAKLVDQVVEIKRHELGMHPPNFDPEDLDPMKALGEQNPGRDRGVLPRRSRPPVYLRNFALTEWSTRRPADR
jgi:hypothetical protein